MAIAFVEPQGGVRRIGWLCFRLLKDILCYWKTLVIVLVPLLFLPLVTDNWGTEESHPNRRPANCAYVVVIMAFYWVFEVVPIAITAVLPMVLYPLLSVISLADACAVYLSKSNFLFVGGLIIAIAIEEVNLHKRIALRVLLFMGSEPKWILCGFMVTTWFLSMWMSNTATTAMMMPIAIAIIHELVKYRMAERRFHSVEGGGAPDRIPLNEPETHVTEADESEQFVDSKEMQTPQVLHKNGPDGMEKHKDGAEELPQFDDWHNADKKLAKCMLIALCYSANIGGTATLTGTVPNVIAQGALQQAKPPNDQVSYANWMASQIVPAILLIIACFFWMQFMFLPIRDICPKKSKGPKNVGFTKILRAQYNLLGSMAFGEWLVLLLYMLLIGLWIFRDPKFIDGWQAGFTYKWTGDAIPAMLISFSLFFLPKERPDFLCFRANKSANPKLSGPLLTWTSMKKFPWDVILLLGGGFSMAKGVNDSGLADILGETLKDNLANEMPSWVFLTIVIVVVTFFTDITSNASVANIFCPIMIGVAYKLGKNPIEYAVPIGVATSYAYMLPVSTPPNAIVYGAGMVAMKDMMIVGFGMNWISIVIGVFCANAYMPLVFDLTNVTIANATNATLENVTSILTTLAP